MSLLICIFSTKAFAIEPYSGQIQRQADIAFLVNGQSATEIESTDPEISNSLRKLHDGDVISGLANFYFGKVNIQTIDFIGLKQLLGTWQSKNTNIVIPSFSELNLVQNLIGPRGERLEIGAQPIKKYIYSVHPSAASGFHLFMSDDKQTILADIEINEQNLQMKVYDSENGSLQKFYLLTKQP